MTYSTELDDVPSEVGKIVDSTVTEMEIVSGDLESVANDLAKKDADVKSALSKIEFTMRFIEKLDTRLKDCQSILSGYVAVLEQQNQKEEPVTKVETPQEKESDTVSEEQSKQRGAKKKAG